MPEYKLFRINGKNMYFKTEIAKNRFIQFLKMSRYFNPVPVFRRSILSSVDSCPLSSKIFSPFIVAPPSGHINIPSSSAMSFVSNKISSSSTETAPPLLDLSASKIK